MNMVNRWVFHDPWDDDPATATYRVPVNPNRMTSPFPERAITAQATASVDGKPVLFEGVTPPKRWNFGGSVMDKAHYEALRHWVYDRTGRRVEITDHFGRKLSVVLISFDPEPQRRLGKFWFHEYTVQALVLQVDAAAADEAGVIL